MPTTIKDVADTPRSYFVESPHGEVIRRNSKELYLPRTVQFQPEATPGPSQPGTSLQPPRIECSDPEKPTECLAEVLVVQMENSPPRKGREDGRRCSKDQSRGRRPVGDDTDPFQTDQPSTEGQRRGELRNGELELDLGLTCKKTCTYVFPRDAAERDLACTETFDFSTPNEWPKWRKRFERYLVVSGMKKKEEADKIDLFMYLMGDRADDIFRTFKFEKEEEATKIDFVLKAFDSHFCVRKNIIYERAKFNSRIQEDREPVDEFITSLYKLADSCEFEGLHEQLIRDRIVVGVRDKALSERMQLDSELTLEKAVKMVRQQEAVRQQQVDLQRPSTSQKVNQVKFNSKKQSPKQQQQPSRKKEKSAKTRSRCPKCGGFTHREGQACRAEGQRCNLCSKTGHFANCCPDKQAKTAEVKAVSELDEEIDFLLEVSAVEDSSNLDDDEGECRRRWTAEIQVNGKQVKFKLDSQADVTCVPLCLFKKIMGQQRLVKSDINIRAAEFSELQTVDNHFLQPREVKTNGKVASRKLEILDKLHAGHFGITKTRLRARETVWWPGISEEIAETVRKCSVCIQEAVSKHEPLIPTNFPTRPWQKIGMDLFKFENKWYLVVIDYYSRFPEMIQLDRLTANVVVRSCKSIFARHGIPEIVVSDNGTQFGAAREFANFARQYGFTHVTSSPRFPQSNGMAEAGVKIAKMILKKNQDPSLGLLEYRSTPLENGYSPAELLMGRKLRTTLPIAPENLNPKLVDSQTLKRKEGRRRKDMKSRYDRRCGATDMEELSEGDTVWITDMRTWGIVKQKASAPRSYMVDTPVGTLRRNRFNLRKGYTVQYPADPSTPTFVGGGTAKVIEIALSMEAAEKNTKLFHLEQGEDCVDKLRMERKVESNFQNGKCKHCGKQHKELCRFKEAICFKCNKKGHIASICWSSRINLRQHQNQPGNIHQIGDQEEEEEYVQKIISVTIPEYKINFASSDPPYLMELKVEGNFIKFEMDTGSGLTLISEKDFKNSLQHLKLEKASIIVRTYDGTVVPILGKINVKVECQDITYKLRALVVKGEKRALMGREWINRLKLGCFAVKHMPVEITIEEILKENQALFVETTE
ncbi:K02A2.6-like, partial [Cordylochernes scorpioides]